MGKQLTGENSEKKEDHPLDRTVRNTNSDEEVRDIKVQCNGEEKKKITGTASTPPQPAMAEDAEEYIKPIIKDGEVILEVECGQNKALLYLSKLCQGSKGPCIYFQGSWLAPNEFQYVSGRETAKDWKRSIRHHGKSLKLLLAKGILTVHPTVCDCEGCRTGSTLNRNRNGTKKKIPNKKEEKTKQEKEGPNTLDINKGNQISSFPEDRNKKDARKQKKSIEKPLSPLRESTSTNIMNPIPHNNHAATEERVPKLHTTVPSTSTPGETFIAPSPQIPVLKQEHIPTTSSHVENKHLPVTTQVKLEDTKDSQYTSSSKTNSVPTTPILDKPTIPTATKPITEALKESSPKISENKERVRSPVQEPKKEPTKESTHPKTVTESTKSKDLRKSPVLDQPHKMVDKEIEKIVPKSIPSYIPRLGSDVPAFRLPDPSLDAAMYADYIRMFQPGHPLLSQTTNSLESLYSLRPGDPAFGHVLHPYHGCSIYNPHSSGLYSKDQMMFPSTSSALPPSITAPCFSPMHMMTPRLPYTLTSPMMDLPRPFGYIPPPSSLPYPCSSISSLKRHHSEVEQSSDINTKRLRLDYPIPDYRFDSYPSCAPAFPPLFYDQSLIQSEEYRRKRLEESMSGSKDMPSYRNPFLMKCACGKVLDDIRNWSVEDVCSFVSRLDGCGVYSETFREQRVDGKILPLLTTDHMMKSLGIKLGPAVLIAEAVAKKLQEVRVGGCDGCRKLSLATPVEM